MISSMIRLGSRRLGLGRGDRAVQEFEDRPHTSVQDRAVQDLFTCEVVVEAGDPQSGRFGDISQGRARIPVLGKESLGSVEDAPGGLLTLATGGRRRFAGCGQEGGRTHRTQIKN